MHATMLMIYISYDRPVIGNCCLLSGYCKVLCENTPCTALYNVLIQETQLAVGITG